MPYHFLLTSWRGNVFHTTGPLCGESTSCISVLYSYKPWDSEMNNACKNNMVNPRSVLINWTILRCRYWKHNRFEWKRSLLWLQTELWVIIRCNKYNFSIIFITDPFWCVCKWCVSLVRVCYSVSVNSFLVLRYGRLLLVPRRKWPQGMQSALYFVYMDMGLYVAFLIDFLPNHQNKHPCACPLCVQAPSQYSPVCNIMSYWIAL